MKYKNVINKSWEPYLAVYYFDIVQPTYITQQLYGFSYSDSDEYSITSIIASLSANKLHSFSNCNLKTNSIGILSNFLLPGG